MSAGAKNASPFRIPKGIRTYHSAELTWPLVNHTSTAVLSSLGPLSITHVIIMCVCVRVWVVS